MSVGIGDRAPDFTLPGTGGTSVSLSDFAGRPVVLVFYPGDDSPVCTKQLNAYNDGLDQWRKTATELMQEFQAKGADTDDREEGYFDEQVKPAGPDAMKMPKGASKMNLMELNH